MEENKNILNSMKTLKSMSKGKSLAKSINTQKNINSEDFVQNFIQWLKQKELKENIPVYSSSESESLSESESESEEIPVTIKSPVAGKITFSKSKTLH